MIVNWFYALCLILTTQYVWTVESTTTTTTMITTPKETQASSGINEALIAGVVVAVIIIVVMAVIIVVLSWKRLKKSRNGHRRTLHDNPTGEAESNNIRNSNIYTEIKEYEELNVQACGPHSVQSENKSMSETVYMTLRPSLMETIRDHLKDQATSNQQVNTLPDFIYDDVYEDGQNPVPLNEIGVLVNQIQKEIEKFRPKYQYEVEVLYTALVDNMQAEGTAIPCFKFENAYQSRFKVDPKIFKFPMQEQYEVLDLLKPNETGVETSGNLPENINKNRHAEIVPNDRYRPTLTTVMEGRTDYINAVLVPGFQAQNSYILTQFPLKETGVDLWRLMNDCNSSTLVMLNQMDDENTDDAYWPVKVASSIQFGPISIRNAGYNVDDSNMNIHFRELRMSLESSDYESQQKRIKQFCLSEWNESTLVADFISLVEAVRKLELQLPLHEGPIIIHCLNGAERSGLFCAALYVVEQINRNQKVDIFSAVKHIRLFRPQCITGMDQYNFLHEFVMEYIRRHQPFASVL